MTNYDETMTLAVLLDAAMARDFVARIAYQTIHGVEWSPLTTTATLGEFALAEMRETLSLSSSTLKTAY